MISPGMNGINEPIYMRFLRVIIRQVLFLHKRRHGDAVRLQARKNCEEALA